MKTTTHYEFRTRPLGSNEEWTLAFKTPCMSIDFNVEKHFYKNRGLDVQITKTVETLQSSVCFDSSLTEEKN